MTIHDLEQRMADYCVNELVVQGGNLVTLKVGIGVTRADDPYIQGMGDDLESALNNAFEQAKQLCASMDQD